MTQEKSLREIHQELQASLAETLRLLGEYCNASVNVLSEFGLLDIIPEAYFGSGLGSGVDRNLDNIPTPSPDYYDVVTTKDDGKSVTRFGSKFYRG